MRTFQTAAIVVAVAGMRVDAIFAQGRRGGPRPQQGVYKAWIAPHWFADDTRFWYRNDLSGGTKEFIVVDATAGTRAPAFDPARLAAALSKPGEPPIAPAQLPFDTIEFVGDHALRFPMGGVIWECDLDSYRCQATDDKAPQAPEPDAADPRARWRGRGRGRDAPQPSPRSPDGKWTAEVKDWNVVLKSEADGSAVELTHDGVESFRYGRLEWSPDSKTLVAFRIEPGDHNEVYRIETSPPKGGRAVLHTDVYALPGDKYDSLELDLFDVATSRQTRPPVDRIDFSGSGDPDPRLRWSADGRRFTYEKVDRGHQRFRLIEVETATGAARNVIDETAKTFLWTAHTENLGVGFVTWLEQSGSILYVSERDGWRHLYLVDPETGEMHKITEGEFVVRGIDQIDEENRQIWFRACGGIAGRDPYFIDNYRVDFDGTHLIRLTDGDGSHFAQFSPDRKFLIDTWSRVDAPPQHALRRCDDGSLVCRLETADISELRASGWQPPEVFVAKGRDGTTDIWGILCRPKDFDPTRKYPVLEQIYNGPQSAYVPKTFSAQPRFKSLTDLGFVVVQMDAMGTAWRSKAFHDVCWHDLGDAGFPDRILWHQAAAKQYPWYDVTRVGIYGGSAGGQNAAGAVIFHPEFYKAAVANSGCHDNRMDKASWNEQWMGYPVGEQYSKSSNIDNAAKLGGSLMLVVGEMDSNVPPESTYRLVDALTKAKKDFDLVVVPGANHGAGSPITERRLEDFFLKHLQGIDPPDRNAEPAQGAAGTQEGS